MNKGNSIIDAVLILHKFKNQLVIHSLVK